MRLLHTRFFSDGVVWPSRGTITSPPRIQHPLLTLRGEIPLITSRRFEPNKAVTNHPDQNEEDTYQLFEPAGDSLTELLEATQPAKLRLKLSTHKREPSKHPSAPLGTIKHSPPGTAYPDPLFHNTLSTRFGDATLLHDGTTLFGARFGSANDPSLIGIDNSPRGDRTLPLPALFLEALEQRHHRPLPLHLFGTPFQIAVWTALMTVCPGEVASYSQIARIAGHPGSQRAVGTAIGANPIAGVIPCHRVIRSNGECGNYRWGSRRKRVMIGWEMVHFDKLKV